MNLFTLVALVVGVFIGILASLAWRRGITRRLARQATHLTRRDMDRFSQILDEDGSPKAPAIRRQHRVRCPICEKLECEHGDDLSD